MFYSLLYISESAVAAAALAGAVDSIVATSLCRNAALHVTGALVANAGRFVQILEGPRTSVDELMVSIGKDSRHRNIRVVDTHGMYQRFFPRWSLAYLGASHDLERQIGLLERAHSSNANVAAAALELAHQIKELAWQHDHWRNGGTPGDLSD